MGTKQQNQQGKKIKKRSGLGAGGAALRRGISVYLFDLILLQLREVVGQELGGDHPAGCSGRLRARSDAVPGDGRAAAAAPPLPPPRGRPRPRPRPRSHSRAGTWRRRGPKPSRCYFWQAERGGGGRQCPAVLQRVFMQQPWRQTAGGFPPVLEHYCGTGRAN